MRINLPSVLGILFAVSPIGIAELLAQGCTLGSVTLNVVAAPQPTITGNNQFCEGGSTTLTVPENFTTYLWSNNDTDQSTTVNSPGTYTVTVTNSAGCTGTATYTVTQLPGPIPSITSAFYNCNGTFTISVTSGFSAYNWSSGQSTDTIITNGDGTYTVTVTDANGCTGTTAVTVVAPPDPVVTITGNNVICANESTVLQATPGFLLYTWSTGGNGESITVTNAGTYTVTVTNAFGCTDTDSFTVSQTPAPTPAITGPPPVCNGQSGTLTVSPTFPEYLWNTNETTQSIDVTNAGTYTVTVTDANGCTGTASFTLSVNPNPVPVITAAPYACNGQITLSAQPGFTTYNWSTNQSGNSITVNADGTYGLTVTDANGCSGTATIDVSIPPPPMVDITGDNQICANGSGTLDATPGFSNYAWSPSGNGPSITVNSAGTYTVTATDANGCTDTATFTITSVPAPVPTISGPPAICDGQSGTLTVTPAFPEYLWNTNETTQSIDVTGAGTYTVTVTDANGCTGTASFTLAVNPNPVPVISAAPFACNGQITLSASPGFTSYNWSTNQSGNTITVNTDGTYTVTVTDANGCTGVDDIVVAIPAPPAVAITGNTEFCQGDNSVLEATPGLNAYVWSTNQTGPNITVFNTGSYTVTATDAFGCTASASITVSILPAPMPTITGPASICSSESATLEVPGSFGSYVWSNGLTGPSITVNTPGTYVVTVTDFSGCTGTAAHTLSVLPSPQPNITAAPYQCNNQLILNAGPGFATYLWSTNQTTNPITVNTSGDYTVTVTAANGCAGTDTFFADIPDDPVVDISGNNQLCQGGSTVLTATPGLNTYQWSNNQTGNSITVSTAGNYGVTATDGFGCTATDVFPVQVVPNPVPTIAGPNSICAGGSAIFSVPGNFVSYLWSTSDNTSSITLSNAGTYTVTVTDANGCTGTASKTLNVSSSLEPQIAEQPYNCNGQITLDAGAGFSTYLWNTNETTSTITVNTSDLYTVTVTDNTGCSGTAEVAVNLPDPPVVGISGPNTICQNASAILEATPGFGIYVWSNNQVGPSITVSQANTYTVTATDGYGCTAEASFDVAVNPAPTTSIDGPQSICANSSGTLTAVGAFSSYAWSNQQNTQSISVNAAGTYTVTVTNTFGCTGTAAQTVSVVTALDPQVSALPYACDGQITLEAASGFAGYLWSTGETTASISVATDDTYTVVVTDASGCTGTEALAVTIPDPPVVAVSGNPNFCENTSTALSATPGFVSYLWSTTETTSDITVNATGNYGVTVTDVLGCTAAASFAATEQPLPTPQISGPAAICTNSSGTLTVPGNYAAYAWSTAETTPSITVNTAGNFGVTVTDAFGCTGSAAQSVSVVTQLDPQVSALPYTCNGQITLEASAGFASYLWSTGETTSTISVATDDTYTVVVTDASGCTGTEALAVTVPDPPVVAVSGNPNFCANSSTALNATPGFVSYLWSTTETTSGITVNSTGNYSVTATDALGCTAVASLSATAQPLPVPQINGPAAICTNSSGTLTVPGNYAAYSWSTAETTPSITVNTAGNFGVTVTDAFGCTGSTAQSVSVVTQLDPQVSALPYTCNGQITLEASAGFAGYLWSTGETTSTISVATDDTYTVVVTDASGCTGTEALAVTVPDPPVVAVSGNPNFCANSSTALSATPGFVSYLWSTTETTSAITVNSTGNYSVTATDALGCTAVASLSATAQPLPVPTISGPAAICTNSSGTLTVGGNFAAYVWSTAETTASITVNSAGNFGVTVTDVFGCTGSTAQSVSVVPQLDPQVSALPYTCNGQITLEASAGFASYLWSTGETTSTISVATDDTYTVVVTDASGCTGTEALAVTVPDPPVVAVSGNPNFCANSSTTLSATPGFVSYLWSTTETTSGITVNATGTYSVTATDALGCTAVASLSATAQPLPVPQINGPAAICTNSSGTLTVSGNYAAYSWSTAETTPSITVNTAGNFGVTVTDAFGCTGSTAQSVSVVTALDPQVSALPYACNGQITLEASAGFAGYLWSTGETTSTISVATDDTYTVVVTDASGCTGTEALAVTIPDPPVVAVSGNPNFCANSSTTLSATPGFVSYLWSTTETTSGITVNATDTYSVTATDALGCTATASLSATAQPLPVPTISGTASLCPGKSGTLSAAGNFVSYQWSTTQNTQTITVTGAGTYVVTVTDLQGCTGTAMASVVAATADTAFVQLGTCDPANVGTSVQVFPGTSGCDSVVITQTSLVGVVVTGTSAVLSNFNGYAVACAGDSNGSAIVTPATGLAPFSYQWSSGATSQVAQNLSADTYSVTFTDSNGCSGTATVTLNEPAPVAPVIDATDPTCQNPGLIEVTQVTGGFGPYTVRLIQDIGTTNGTQPINFSTLDAGTFEIEVTDANGCKANETVVLLPAEAIEEFVSDTFVIFKGDTVTLNAGAGITIQPLFITWTPATDLSCDDCLDPSIAPVSTTLVELDVAGFGGCKATGLFLIIVKATGTYYAPNVIKPGSNDNYGFTIYGDKDLVNIRQLQVYDRWGNHVAVFNNIVPNDPARGWDGRFNGQDMNPAVFVWWAELEFSDGSTQIVKGDVTVVR